MKKSIKILEQDKTKWIKAFVMAGVGIVFVGILCFFCQIVVSETDSLPEHYFIRFPLINPQKGHYTLFFSQWYGGNIIKKIVGIEGDVVWYDKENRLWVNETPIGRLKPKASDDRPLTPLKPQTIPKGFVFVYASHQKSFDSRYRELGLVPISVLKGRLVGLR